MEQVLTKGGFTGVSANPKRRRALNKRVVRWVVKATAKSDEDFKEISTTITDRSPRHLNGEYTIAVTAEKVRPKQHARTYYVDSDFGQKVVRSKPPAAPKPEGVDLTSVASDTEFMDAETGLPVEAAPNAAASGGRVGETNGSETPGTKTGAAAQTGNQAKKPHTAAKSREPPPGMRKRTNPGMGNCVFWACAQAMDRRGEEGTGH